ncbi:MAG: hypothetical protein KDB27_19245 [Planctomycetales bacterium]|nr:hypothetical protein [Planctomycetales bacterium]
MNAVIHRTIVILILIAGFVLARQWPAEKTSRKPAESASHVPDPLPRRVPDGNVKLDALSLVSPSIKPVTTSEPVAETLSAEQRERLNRSAGATSDLARSRGLADPQQKNRPASRARMLPEIDETKSRTASASRNARSGRMLPSIKEAQEVRQKRKGRLIKHRIADGDELRLLAGKYLDDESRFMEIFELNRKVLQHPELLPVGTEIQVYDERP